MSAFTDDASGAWPPAEDTSRDAEFQQLFAITVFTNASATRKAEQQITLSALADRIRATQAPTKSQLPWLKLARFGDQRTDKHSLRHDANVEVITGIEVDYDGGVVTVDQAEDLLLKSGVLSLLYTSPSHTEGAPRWRVLCPTSVELPPDRRTPLMGRLNGVLHGAASSESWTLSQSYYFGRVGNNPAHDVRLIPGTPIDLLDELDQGWWGKAETKAAAGPRDAGQPPRSGPLDEQALIQQIIAGDSYHAAYVRLLGRWALDGVPMMEARSRLQTAMGAVPESDRDDRWKSRYADIDRCLGDIYVKEADKRDAGTATSAASSSAAPAGAQKPVPAYTLGALLDDASPMPADLIGPRLLTPGGMLVLGGAPKVGKSDFLLNLLVHAAAGVPFLRFTSPRPLRIFYLQAEIQYDYLRERLQQLRLDPAIVARARDTLVVTPKLRMLLDETGVGYVIGTIREVFPDAPPDAICIDPIRNLFDGGPGGEGENDNNAMLFFLQSRVEALRDEVAPEAGIILVHHTKKVTKQQVKEDPFLSLSGASALRGFYTSGMILFRPEEEETARELHIELRNGPALEPMRVDKRGGAWVELDRDGERIVRKDLGRKLDAERTRRHDVILQIIADEAEQGRLCTVNAFASKFENNRGLGGKDTIRDRIGVLSIKGYIKFRRDVRDLGLPNTTSKHGYLVVRDMVLGPDDEVLDPETGEITRAVVPVLPSHYICPQSESLLEVENPAVWVLHDPEEAP
jgi:hypothetical protein